MALGSDIINVAASGLPIETEDRGFAFCIGTQLLQTPSATPRTGTILFKIDPERFVAPVSGDTVGSAAIGLATAANISTLANWSTAAEIQDDGGAHGVYALSFAELQTNSTVVNVCAAGQSVATVAKDRLASGISVAFDTLTSNNHGYGLGDAVVIASGFLPVPLASDTRYFVIPSGTDQFKLAASLQDALNDEPIDITVSGGPILLKSDDEWRLQRDGNSGEVSISRNGQEISSFPIVTLESLRPFFWSRERSNSATLPVFKQIKVSGAS